MPTRALLSEDLLAIVLGEVSCGFLFRPFDSGEENSVVIPLYETDVLFIEVSFEFVRRYKQST